MRNWTPQQAEEELRFCNSYSRLPTLLEIARQMDERDWLALLGQSWEVCDNVGEHLELLLASPFGDRLGGGAITEMMNADEQAAYDALPSVVTVYRGCYKSNKWGFCWSLDRNVAQRFPTFIRYRQNGQPLLVKAEAKKQDIAAVKLGRNELEIITHRPKHISTSFIREQAGTEFVPENGAVWLKTNY